jgi:hypothetical protein
VNEDQIARLIRTAWDEHPPDDLDQIIAEARRRERAAARYRKPATAHRWPLTVWLASFLLPRAHRARYAAEWAAELEYVAAEQGLRAQRLQGLRILLSTPWTALLLLHAWVRRVPAQKRFERDLLAAVVTAVGVAAVTAATLADAFTSHELARSIYAALGAGLTGLLAGVSLWRERRHSRDSDDPQQESDLEER